MIDVRIKYNGVRVRLRGVLGMRRLHNLRALQVGLDSVKKRLARGIGSDDQPTLPLKKRYAIFKARITKRRAIRDLRLTGAFLDTFLPRYADDHQAVAYAAGRLGRLKAIEHMEHLLFSRIDQEKMRAYLGDVFQQQVSEVAYRLAPRAESTTKEQRAGFRKVELNRRQAFAPVSF